MMSDPYKNLAQAIVLAAVKDYKTAARALKKNPNNVNANRMIKECERFFLSQWFIELTDVDGKVVLEKLREECK